MTTKDVTEAIQTAADRRVPCPPATFQGQHPEICPDCKGTNAIPDPTTEWARMESCNWIHPEPRMPCYCTDNKTCEFYNGPTSCSPSCYICIPEQTTQWKEHYTACPGYRAKTFEEIDVTDIPGGVGVKERLILAAVAGMEGE